MSDTSTSGPFREQFDALVRTVVTASTDLRGALTSVAEMGCSDISGCAAASITLIEDGTPRTVACSDDFATDLDQV
ncbi:MAG: hypothetical protein ACR2MO_01430 [Acidimicrobiales bacterium]